MIEIVILRHLILFSLSLKYLDHNIDSIQEFAIKCFSRSFLNSHYIIKLYKSYLIETRTIKGYAN